MLNVNIEEWGEAAVRHVATALKAVGAARGRATDQIDPSVKASLLEMGKLFSNGVESIDWIVPAQPGKPRSGLNAKFDDRVLARIDGRSAKGKVPNEVTLDGRLEMADFKVGDLKCLIHLRDGRRVVTTFSSDLEEDVYAALRRIVRVSGLGTYARPSNVLEKLELHSVEILNPTFIERDDFFTAQSLADLTAAQGVDPTVDLTLAKRAWPDDEDVEAFLSSIGEQ
jgi:hypothetical protein